ncbi:MAG: hypothetical protein ACYDAA_10400 [Syntrophales bacterium]
MAVSRITRINQKPASGVKSQDTQLHAGAKRYELSGTSLVSPPAASAISEIPFALKTNRPPLRKYIRKEGTPGNQRIVVQVAEQKPEEISLASVKEKFGLAEFKIGRIIRDADKFGTIRKAMNGSYPY